VPKVSRTYETHTRGQFVLQTYLVGGFTTNSVFFILISCLRPICEKKSKKKKKRGRKSKRGEKRRDSHLSSALPLKIAL
jgi:hypothetical protein